jgi:hypothetical protein
MQIPNENQSINMTTVFTIFHHVHVFLTQEMDAVQNKAYKGYTEPCSLQYSTVRNRSRLDEVKGTPTPIYALRYNICLFFPTEEIGGRDWHSSVLYPALFNDAKSTTDIRKLNEKW